MNSCQGKSCQSIISGELSLKSSEKEVISITEAREHNLKSISLDIPRNKLVVITGLSGSGKSSLAFDTIYAEGQRRYMESFSAYARQFMGDMERPDVDKIEGLSPVISIEQKTTNKNPRSTVGTITEIYDFLRLLYARVADAYSYVTGKKMEQLSDEQILQKMFAALDGNRISILSPLIRARKGHYRELFQNLRKQGFLKVRVDGEILELVPNMKVDRYKAHDIELVIDRLKVEVESKTRMSQSVQLALDKGNGVILVVDHEKDESMYFSRNLMDPESGISYDEPQPNTFSFNSPYGACKECNGLGETASIEEDAIVPDDSLSIDKGGIAPFGLKRDVWMFRVMKSLSTEYGFSLSEPISDLKREHIDILLYGTEGYDHSKAYLDFGYYKDGRKMAFEGVIPMMRRHYSSRQESLQRWSAPYVIETRCGECKGYRLKREALHFKILGKHIGELAFKDLEELQIWIGHMHEKLNRRKMFIAQELLKEIRDRVRFLNDIGLGYLNLNRGARTLSGGESQRIRLATQIGSQLVGVLYILDEPSIGLHQRDNHRLIESLKELREIGNSVIVVEHDKDMILQSDYIIDMGPGAGKFGGDVVASGDPEGFMNSASLTAHYINGEKVIEVPKQRRTGTGKKLKITGARGHNLRKVNASFPLGTLICVTGVSGSGKSSLINETLYPELSRNLYRSKRVPLPHSGISGLKHIDKVIEIDQAPIGRTPRSNPATYTGVFTDIRNLFSMLPEAKIRGYKPGRFSFNVKGGRCEECKGAGVKVIEMNFLPDVQVKCDHCHGHRYNRETLEVRFKGKSINDVLNMSIDEALEFFEAQPGIIRKIRTLHDVGLGYITLGQPSTTLSGGEAQRVKLSSELSKRDTGNTFYILDEPTTGLHFEDVRVLLEVLNKLVDKGNTVLVIEHNMDVIKMADHIIDIGPDGGRHGGEVVFEGSPEALALEEDNHTARFLREELNN